MQPALWRSSYSLRLSPSFSSSIHLPLFLRPSFFLWFSFYFSLLLLLFSSPPFWSLFPLCVSLYLSYLLLICFLFPSFLLSVFTSVDSVFPTLIFYSRTLSLSLLHSVQSFLLYSLLSLTHSLHLSLLHSMQAFLLNL